MYKNLRVGALGGGRGSMLQTLPIAIHNHTVDYIVYTGSSREFTFDNCVFAST